MVFAKDLQAPQLPTHPLSQSVMYSCELYNNLPSLHEARERLISLPGGPENVLKALAPIFKLNPEFGICLVHAHCTLDNGEKMVSSGRVSEPAIVDSEAGESCYPERWLANGDPYEFSSTPTVEGGAPPFDLVQRFYHRLESISENLKSDNGSDSTKVDLSGLLGIYYVHDPDADSSDESSVTSGTDSDSGSVYRSPHARDDVIWVERTEGRRNIVEPVPREEANLIPNAIPAAWFVTSKRKEGSDDEWIIEVSSGCTCIATSTRHSAKWIPPGSNQVDDTCNYKHSLIADFCATGIGKDEQ